MTLDLALVERRVRRAYEFGRIRHSVLSGAPLITLIGFAFCAGAQRWLDGVLASALGATVLTYLWQGQLAERSLRPGIVAGLYPLVLALVANGISPGCGHGTMSLCTSACAIGGTLAALHLTRYATHEAVPSISFGLAVLPTLLLGALGCGCVGFTGVLFMAGALLLVSLPSLVRWA